MIDANDFVGEGCWLVGHRNPDSLLQCNTYLRTFDGDKTIRWCVDPGSQIDYPVVRRKLLEHVGSLSELHMFSINHQDPDVVGNLIYMTEENPRLIGLTTEDVWRLVRHLKSAPGELRFTNKFRGNTVKLPGGRRIQIVPTPFCHFRGAVAFYDPEARILFSGDLFGGLNRPGRVQVWGESEDWLGIAVFHQIYMPTRAALEFAIRQVRALDPPVQIIAPQHGFLLRGAFMDEVLERLAQLPVGMDRLAMELDDAYLADYSVVFDEVFALAVSHLGLESALDAFRGLDPHEGLGACLTISTDEVRIKGQGIRTLPLAIDLLAQRDSHGLLGNRLRSHALEACLCRKVPIPALGVGVSELGTGSIVI
jgi:eukaryotic-like serine/threonine-protein kinase